MTQRLAALRGGDRRLLRSMAAAALLALAVGLLGGLLTALARAGLLDVAPGTGYRALTVHGVSAFFYWLFVAQAALLGFASYGASLTLFVIALRHLGTARTGAYFSVAPFFGTLLAILLLNEPVTPQLLVAGLLMALGVWLHLSEQHEHGHRHEALEHTHEHVHGELDDHHIHNHPGPVLAGTSHTHRHQHASIEHTHAHFPDAHHAHKH